LDAVSSSSSLTRSRMGCTCRCTYPLLANGCKTSHAKPGSSPSQKSVWSLSAGCALEFELVCCANAGSASTVDKSSVVHMRFFISSSFGVGSLRAPRQPDGQCWRHMAAKPETSNLGNEVFFLFLVTD